MAEKFLNENNVRVRVRCDNWEEALSECGNLLVNNKKVTSEYVKEIIRATKELGPYHVIAPGIAFGHSRPGESVLEDCIALITLDEPVKFNHKTNDPVSLVFVFGAKSDNSHLDVLQSLAEIISADGCIEQLNSADTVQEVLEIINI